MEGPLRYDHYKVLGIPRDATERHIKQAYRRLVKECHPDRNPSPRAAAAFQAVHEAWTVLGDPERRRLYDERLRFHRQATGEAMPDPHPRDHHGHRAQRWMEHPPTPLQRFAYVGLHVTGLLFGVTVVGAILIGIAFLGWPGPVLILGLPGMAAIPASIEGLRG